MSLLQEIRFLSPLRKNQQIVSFFLLFVNAMMLAITTILYIKTFGAEGLVIKGYSESLYGLVLLIPFFGRFALKHPMIAFNIALCLEVLSVILYILTSQNVMPSITLPLATTFVLSSNLLMRPINIQANSIINAGSSTYSLLSSKLDASYTAIGAMVGGLFIFFNAPTIVMITCFALTLIASRYYRKKVLIEIYVRPDNNQTQYLSYIDSIPHR